MQKSRKPAALAIIAILMGITLSCLGPLASPSRAADRVYIDINAPYARKFPVAVTEMKPLGGVGSLEEARQMSEVIRNDLDFCGLFQPLDPKGFLEDWRTMGLTAATTNFQAWSMVKAEFLIKGGFTSDGQSFVCELRLFDVRRGQLLTGKRYSGTIKDYRIMAHKFSDEVMAQITGEQGIFQTRMAFVSTSTGYKEIYVSDFDGYAPTQLTNYRSISLDPTWSMDNSRLAFTSYKDGQPYLYRMDANGQGVRRIISRKGLNITPAYHPDGQSMAVTLSFTGDQELYLITTGGQVIKRLTDSRDIDVQPSFSPDGRSMAFVSKRQGSPQIFIMDLDSGATRRLTYEGKYNTSPAWSPRGDRIAYVGMEDNRFDIFTIAVDGSDRQQLTYNQRDNEHPSWSADGRMIAFASNRSGATAIYGMTANGGHVKRVTSMRGKQTSPSWSGRLWR